MQYGDKVKLHLYRLGQVFRLLEIETPGISGHLAHGKVTGPTHQLPLPHRDIHGTHFC